MKTYYDSMLKGENTALHFPSFRNEDGVQKLVASMPDDLALGEWELHTFDDMKSNDNDQRANKYWSQDIIKSMRWVMRQPAFPGNHDYAPRHCCKSDTPQKRPNIEMHTADWWLESLLRRDTRA